MTYCVSVYCTSVSRSRHEWNACAHQQWQYVNSTRPAKLEGFRNMKFTELSQGAFIFMNFHIILTFLGLYSMLLNAVLRPQNVRKRDVCLQTAPCRDTPDFSAYIAEKSSRRHFCFKLVNLYLLYEIRNRVWRDCKQSSINKSLFSSENFQILRAMKDSPWLCAT